MVKVLGCRCVCTTSVSSMYGAAVLASTHCVRDVSDVYTNWYIKEDTILITWIHTT